MVSPISIFAFALMAILIAALVASEVWARRRPPRSVAATGPSNAIEITNQAESVTAAAPAPSLTAELVRGRENFWGYGSFEAPTWFIGREEGGDPSDELAPQFRGQLM